MRRPRRPGGPGADAEAVFSAAPSDLEAADAVRAYASTLANGISALVLTLDPDLVVIGGGLSRAGDQLLQPLRDRVNELCLTAPRTEVSELGDESVALGAVRTALDHIDIRSPAHESDVACVAGSRSSCPCGLCRVALAPLVPFFAAPVLDRCWMCTHFRRSVPCPVVPVQCVIDSLPCAKRFAKRADQKGLSSGELSPSAFPC
ncbi:ROK family protein [Streptomyces sp. NPDC046942]|uniref:ROK family protein n=1 Tax=Streptomyces sp. NPDC046942 TaxID=3155137 RepID=UPI0033E442D2